MLLSGSVEFDQTCRHVQASFVDHGGLSVMLRAHPLLTAYFSLRFTRPTGSPVFCSVSKSDFVNMAFSMAPAMHCLLRLLISHCACHYQSLLHSVSVMMTPPLRFSMGTPLSGSLSASPWFPHSSKLSKAIKSQTSLDA